MTPKELQLRDAAMTQIPLENHDSTLRQSAIYKDYLRCVRVQHARHFKNQLPCVSVSVSVSVFVFVCVVCLCPCLCISLDSVHWHSNISEPPSCVCVCVLSLFYICACVCVRARTHARTCTEQIRSSLQQAEKHLGVRKKRNQQVQVLPSLQSVTLMPTFSLSVSLSVPLCYTLFR
jgi:hypothetical protein